MKRRRVLALQLDVHICATAGDAMGSTGFEPVAFTVSR